MKLSPIRFSSAALLAMQRAWRRLSTRERAMLGGGGAFLAATLVWQFLWAPAYQDSAVLARQIPLLQQQLAAMQEQASSATDLASQRVHGPAPRGADLQLALQADMTRQDWLGATATLQGDRVRLILPRVSFATWMAWLTEMQRRDKLHVSSAHIAALKPQGQVAIDAVLEGSA